MSTSQLILGVKLRDDARFDNFLGERNRDVASRLIAVLDQPVGIPVIAICGDSDTGKSHLLQAVCHDAENRGRTAVCISLSELQPFGPEALAGLDVQDIVCLDDFDNVVGQAAWEEAIFHLYNRVHDRGGLLLVSLSEVPGATPFQLPDLKSRLSHGLTLQLGIYRDKDRERILVARAEQRGLVMGEDVVTFIMRRAPRRLGDLLGILDTLDENSLKAQRRLTIPFVKSVMGW
ncbi:DnaA regulatory inactivator Hda [Marinobacter salinexigens]|uniref:DnaA regulatory inactivator Hda n=1 Tax=Marinobacter salinexigens TaxID=2919747 RepID=A0A5B0VHN8_9GAMM|nr:DnaA regulatory inactivator Hda [Marinobacter salinexigens]KAA1173743.1 DnaA regulatory inactivator Hda [Marinobacter salinexigens]